MSRAVAPIVHLVPGAFSSFASDCVIPVGSFASDSLAVDVVARSSMRRVR